MKNNIDNYDKSESHQNTDGTGHKPNDNRLRIKYTGNILLGCTDCSEDTDFLGTLQYRNVSNDTDHNGGYHKGDCHKGNEYVGNRIDYRSNGGH